MASLCSGRETLETGLEPLRGTKGPCGGWPSTTTLPVQPQQLQTSLRRWGWDDAASLLLFVGWKKSFNSSWVFVYYFHFIQCFLLYIHISPVLPPLLHPSCSPCSNLITNNSISFQVWDAVAGEELHTFSHSHIVKTVDFSPDSTELLTGSNEKLLKIFDLGKPEAGTRLMCLISVFGCDLYLV